MIVDGYVRVSQVAGRKGKSFISPSVQRGHIEAWAERHGASLAHVFEELDESGARADRPLLEAAIKRVEDGETEGLVVAYLSRFGRSLVDGLHAIKRITEADGSFVSVQENIDFSGDTGRFIVRLMLSIAEWELDRVRTMWRVADERAVKRGVFMGVAPFGYRRGKDGRLRVDPRTGPIVTELFRRRAAGATDRELCVWLMESGVRTPKGNTWWWSVLGLLGGRAYLGESRWGATVNLSAHKPLVDSETWQLAQFRGYRRPVRSWGIPPLLWGIARCAGCQRPLATTSSGYGTSAAQRSYVCCGRVGPRRCPAPVGGIVDRIIEQYVEALFWQQLDRRRRPRKPARLTRLEKIAAQRDRELDAYRDNSRLPITLGEHRFAAGVAVRVHRADAARLAVVQARRATSAAPLPDAGELRGLWPSMTQVERRGAIAEVIDAVFVSPARRSPGRERMYVVLRGEAPVDLPNTGQPKLPRAAPFDPADYPPPPRLLPAREWSPTELDRELGAFLDGRDRWPSFAEFQAAGRTQLWEQVDRQGGSLRWAARHSLPFVAPHPTGDVWTDELVRARLAPFLAGKNEWPATREFRAAGQAQLRVGVAATGGPARWAKAMGVKLPTGRGAHTRWSYGHILEEVEQLAAGTKQFPTTRQFWAAGRSGLYRAIYKRGLADQIATDLDLQPHPRRSQRPNWTDETIRHALDPLLQGRRTWPIDPEFRRAGLASLPTNFSRNGTLERWAREYGIEPPAKPFHWSDAGIKRALDRLLEGRDAWPSSTEFKENGLSGLWTTLRNRGVLEQWRDQYGLPRAKRRGAKDKAPGLRTKTAQR